LHVELLVSYVQLRQSAGQVKSSQVYRYNCKKCKSQKVSKSIYVYAWRKKQQSQDHTAPRYTGIVKDH